MSLADKWAETIYLVVTTRHKLKIMLTPLAVIFWFGLSVVLVFASLWLDKRLHTPLLLPTPVNILLSLLPLIIGAAVRLWTVYDFIKSRGSPFPLNPPQELIITGLYSRVRNPMLLGWFLMLSGVGILLSSISLIIIFTPLFILLNALYIKTIEEKEMERKFGEHYLKYKASVPMFIPRLGK